MGLDVSMAVCCTFPVLVSLLLVRFADVMYHSGHMPSKLSASAAGMWSLIVLGSGGHTAEMMNVVTTLQKDRFTPRYYVAALTDNMSLQKAQVYEQSLVRVEKDRFTPRYYVAALTDNMSLQKAQVYEQSLVRVEVDKEEGVENAQFVQIYRSREVGQSYITSIATTLLATSHAIWIIIRIRPQVVLGLGWSSIFYIESIARVKKLSLSGLLLYKLRIADQFFVQWPQLQQKYPRACYAGSLM
uniref:UDP-N-acetylglucosamine transferase subunit ALG14 n=1 Tax=Oryza meridionalis TaxID=40149 RepID=A0A0E0D284_9ORYZ